MGSGMSSNWDEVRAYLSSSRCEKTSLQLLVAVSVVE